MTMSLIALQYIYHDEFMERLRDSVAYFQRVEKISVDGESLRIFERIRVIS